MIRLQCVCRQTLSLPESLAGQKVRCKKCGKVLKVPKSGTRRFSEGPAEEDSDSELVVAGSRRCPGCAKTYPPAIVVCTECGLNLNTGAMLYASLGTTDETQVPDGVRIDQRPEGLSWFGKMLWKLGIKR